MSEALEGSQALAQAVVLCRPQVVAAYPITPQTHIVENISKLVADGKTELELVSVESEFSAASVALGAAAAGARAYTASASQGILLMSEVLFNIAGLRVPMVLTCANRAVGAPLSIWNDQSDSMAVRDAGWIQLYCADNQEAIDTTIQAYRIAEETELPVMVCVDGFTLTHTLEPLALPSQDEVDGYLPPYQFSRALDVAKPISMGTLVGPERFAEARHAHHQALLRSTHNIQAASDDWAALSGRDSGGLLTVEGDPDARTGILSLGSMTGTLAEAMETWPELAEAQSGVKLIRLRAFRPFPVEALREACAGLERLAVMERAFCNGLGGIVGTEVAAVLGDIDIYNYAVGLGGRDIPLETYPRLLEAMSSGDTTFQILDADLTLLPEEDQ